MRRETGSTTKRRAGRDAEPSRLGVSRAATRLKVRVAIRRNSPALDIRRNSRALDIRRSSLADIRPSSHLSRVIRHRAATARSGRTAPLLADILLSRQILGRKDQGRSLPAPRERQPRKAR